MIKGSRGEKNSLEQKEARLSTRPGSGHDNAEDEAFEIVAIYRI